ARVPPPADARVVEAVADGRRVGRVGLAVVQEGGVVVDRLEQLVGGRARPGRRLGGLGGVDRGGGAGRGQQVVRRQVAVDQGGPARVQGGNEARGVGRQRLVPLRGGGGDQELVVEERAAEGRVEEVIVQRVLLGQQPLGQVGRVDVTQHQA